MSDVAVIGAGIVGLATALQLRLDGHHVTLFDPNDPASGCSSGNAGYLSEANIFPPASTEGLRKLPQMLFERDGPIVIRPGYLPAFVPWGLKAVIASRPSALSRTVVSMAALIRPAIKSYEPLTKAAGAGHLIDKCGALVVCRTPAGLRGKLSRLQTMHDHGIAVEQIDREQIFEMEPELARDIIGGLYYPNSARCLNPRTLGERFAEHLLASGSAHIRTSVRQILPNADGSWRILCADGEHRASRLVVAAGRWSDELMRPLGYHAPLEAERGYHLMLPAPGVALSRPVSMAEAYFVATPMAHGLRLAGTVEFAGTDWPMNPKRSDMLFRLAQPYLPGLRQEQAERWMGVRPSLPDGLPAVGAASGHRNLFYCFGHNHNGLMQAAISGRLVADLVGGLAPTVDPAPYRLERFGISRRLSKELT